MGSDPMIFNIINKKNAYKEHIQLCKIISRDIFYAKNHIRCGCGFSSYIFIIPYSLIIFRELDGYSLVGYSPDLPTLPTLVQDSGLH